MLVRCDVRIIAETERSGEKKYPSLSHASTNGSSRNVFLHPSTQEATAMKPWGSASTFQGAKSGLFHQNRAT
jgi:hypothetical protein